MESNAVGTIVSSALLSTTLTGLLVWVLKRWLGEQLTQSIRQKYEQQGKDYSALLAERAEDRTRQLEKNIAYLERQIQEFYGPLWSVEQQLFACNETKETLEQGLSDDAKARLDEYYQTTYFRPLHDEIRGLLKSKLYLARGVRPPASIYGYLLHATQERDQRDLAKLHGVDTSRIPGRPWPKSFEKDMKQGYDKVMDDYESTLSGLLSKSGYSADERKGVQG